MDNRYSGGHLLLAALLGALAGAGVALLFAPRVGKDARNLIVERFSDAKTRVKQVPQAVKEASSAAKEAFTGSMQGS